MDLALARGLSWRDRAPTYRRPGMHHASDERTRHHQCGEHVCHPSLSVQMAVHGSGGSARRKICPPKQNNDRSCSVQRKLRTKAKEEKAFHVTTTDSTPATESPAPHEGARSHDGV